MAGGDIVLQFGLKPGENANAVAAAESLIEWVALLKEAVRAMDPNDEIRVELIGRELGSLRQLLRIVEDTVKTADEGASEFPYLKKVAIGLAIATSSAAIQTELQQLTTPSVQAVSLSPADRELLHGMQDRIRADPGVQKAEKRFFRSVERDKAITNVQIAEDFDAAPLVSSPEANFRSAGGYGMPKCLRCLTKCATPLGVWCFFVPPSLTHREHGRSRATGSRFLPRWTTRIFWQPSPLAPCRSPFKRE